jgi:hypothetical protein
VYEDVASGPLAPLATWRRPPQLLLRSRGELLPAGSRQNNKDIGNRRHNLCKCVSIPTVPATGEAGEDLRRFSFINFDG